MSIYGSMVEKRAKLTILCGLWVMEMVFNGSLREVRLTLEEGD